MKWMKERDLLIAQTMAFVQSVTGKKPEAENTVARRSSLHPSRHPKPPVRPQPITTPVTQIPFQTLRRCWRKRHPRRGPTSRLKRRLRVPWKRQGETGLPLARPDLRDEFQSEIKARIANFRAHQERFNREREAYCTATMAKVHASLKQGELPPPRLDK